LVQRLSEEHGAHTTIRALRFLHVRLSAFSDAASIAQEIDQARSELAEAQERFEVAYTERLAATAEVSYRDDVLDAAVLNLADEALRAFPEQRNDPRYLLLFPIAPIEAVASTASHRQSRFVHQLVATLQNEAAMAPLAAHGQVISKRQAQLEAALAQREERFQQETLATRRRNEALEEACRTYNRSFSRLQLLFRDGRRIQSLYPNLPGVRSPDSEL
jgi:hypothetical protein